MAKLSKDDVAHIAKLARLTLNEGELERFSGELTAILKYIEQLQEVDTSSVEALGNVTGQSHMLREDVVLPGGADPDALLSCTALPLVDRQIQTPSAHG